ncbi:potassium channel subfamily K member 3-like [Arctopsyche grandis]|uniref:potassium channel subfamily K member 3-like n=1 Tax=Arctopsyche grandis TaxID=121162 RepID=UPI00406D8393
MKKQNVRTLSLIVCTFTYLLVGAAVFDALESETEKKRWDVLQAIEYLVINKYNISPEDFKVMETVVLKTEPHKAGQQWKFTGAFYYATTVLTTIGYGHSTPCTIGGKLFTMFYAIVGIPLGLVMFQSIGERVNKLSSVIIRSVKRSLNCRQTGASDLDLICVVTTLSSLTIAGGAAAFSRFEGWSYFDSVYYCFITLTTIGFGDMVALQKDNALNRKPSYVMFALIFILFGLAIVAASLNLLVLRFVTMNTEDEKRDEQQAIQALRGAVRLEGDVITADGAILRGVSKGTRQPADPRQILQGNNGSPNIEIQYRGGPLVQLPSDDSDTPSVCSCHCNCFRKKSQPYRDPLSPIPPPPFRSMSAAKAKQNENNLLNKIPRYIEKASSKNHSQTLRLNSASGYLFMNAKNDFQIDSDDVKEMMKKRRQQLLEKSRNAFNYETFRRNNNNDRTSKQVSTPSDIDGRCMSMQLYESRRSSFYSSGARSENEKRSHDPLVDDSSKDERSSYSKRKIMKNVNRNIPDPRRSRQSRRVVNYFYDEDIDIRLEDNVLLDASTVFAKKHRPRGEYNDSVCVYRRGDAQEYSWTVNGRSTADPRRQGGDVTSNDGSVGYFLTDDNENNCRFALDTLTFNQPPHRASV